MSDGPECGPSEFGNFGPEPEMAPWHRTRIDCDS